MTRELTFTTWGRPSHQGNIVKSRQGHVFDKTKGLGTWKRHVVKAAREAATTYALDHPTVWHALDCPVAVAIRLFIPRPNGHYGTGRNAGIVKPDAPRFPITNGGGATAVGDIDKQARAILDPLTDAGIIFDDSRVVKLIVEQLYALQPQGARAVITVREYDPPSDTPVGALPIELAERIPS